MKKMLLTVFSVFAFLVLMTSVASAATVSYNTSLSTPPGVYYGAGNPNTSWAVYNDGDIELGLTAFIRYTGGSTVSGNTYTVPLGATTVPGKSGSAWGFAFSANTLGGEYLSGYAYDLKIENLGNGMSTHFDPTLIPDNSYWQGGKTMTKDLANQTGFQNGEAPSFWFIGSPIGYDMNANDTYRITLSATSVSGFPSISSMDKSLSIMVNAGSGAPGQVPEPGTYSLMGLGFGTLFLLRRKKG